MDLEGLRLALVRVNHRINRNPSLLSHLHHITMTDTTQRVINMLVGISDTDMSKLFYRYFFLSDV